MDTSTSDLQLRLARKIVKRIHEGSIEYGQHLREIELSEDLGVSRTPVRAVLSYLTSLGLVEKRENRGFFVVANKEDCLPFLQEMPKTDDEQIKEMIAKTWFEGDISKEVSEGEIRKRFSLGRSTAQRILNGLAEEGIISRMPGYGWQFEPTLNTAKAHDESYDFRMIIEPGAIVSSGFRYKAKAGAALKERHQRIVQQSEMEIATAELFGLDADFHSFIAECSQNRFVIQAINQQNRLRRLLEYNSLVNTGRFVASCLEHLEILDALQTGQNKNAAVAMKKHLKKAKDAGPDFQLEA